MIATLRALWFIPSFYGRDVDDRHNKSNTMIAGNRYDLNSVQSSIWFPYFAHRPPRYKTLWKSWLSSHVDPDFMSNKAPLQFVSAMIYYLARKSAWMPHFWRGVNTWLPDLWLFCTTTDMIWNMSAFGLNVWAEGQIQSWRNATCAVHCFSHRFLRPVYPSTRSSHLICVCEHRVTPRWIQMRGKMLSYWQ